MELYLHRDGSFFKGCGGIPCPPRPIHNDRNVWWWTKRDVLKFESYGSCAKGFQFTLVGNLGEIAYWENAWIFKFWAHIGARGSICHNIQFTYEVPDVSGKFGNVRQLSCLSRWVPDQFDLWELEPKACDLWTVEMVFLQGNVWIVWLKSKSNVFLFPSSRVF